MKTCPSCGRSVLDKAIMCAYCGASLPAPELEPSTLPQADDIPEEIPAPIGPEFPEIPEEPAKRRLSRKALIAMICAAAVLLTGVLVFFLTREETTDNRLRSKKEVYWTEVDGKETERRTTTYSYDERGLLTRVSAVMVEAGSTMEQGEADFVYQYDKHGNPKSLVVTTLLADSDPETLNCTFANQYEGNKLVRVDITTDQGSAVELMLQLLNGFTGYRDALLVGGDTKVQLMDGKCVRFTHNTGDAYVSETTHEYKDDILVWTIQTDTRDGEEWFRDVLKYDEHGFITYETIKRNGVSRTYALIYEETTDLQGRSCLIQKIDPDNSVNLTDEDITDFRIQRCYTGNDGSISEIVYGDEYDYSSIRYDDRRRVISILTRDLYGNNTVEYSETTYEYR